MDSKRDTVPAFQIPTSHAKALGELAGLSEEDFAALLAVLTEEMRTIDCSAVGASIAATGLFDETDARALMDSITELSSVRHATSASAAEIGARVLASDPFDSEEDALQTLLAQRVVEVLDCSNVRLAGKALELGSIRERVFGFAEIHTDLRPVFGDDDDLVAESGVLAHVLRLHYISSEGSHNDFFVALDNQDLEMLRYTIDRAEKKSETLLRQLQEAGLCLVGKGLTRA